MGSDGKIVDAIMDVVVAFPNATRQYWFDVTVRSPHAARYNDTIRHNAAEVQGFCRWGRV